MVDDVLSRYKRQISDEDLLNLSPEELCKDRLSEEYFRLTTEGDCRDVVRCDRAGLAGTIRLAAVRCPAGLAFDIDRQTCDWKAKVASCDRLSSKKTVNLICILLYYSTLLFLSSRAPPRAAQLEDGRAGLSGRPATVRKRGLPRQEALL